MRRWRTWTVAKVVPVLGIVLVAMALGTTAQAGVAGQARAGGNPMAGAAHARIAEGPPPIPGYDVTRLINYGSRKCMGTFGGGSAAGTKVVQFDCLNHADQFWAVDTSPG